MPLSSRCPGCGRKGTVPDRLAGARLKCPGCGGIFVAPELPTAAAPPAPEVDLYGLEDEPEPAVAPPPPAEPAAPKTKTKAKPKRAGAARSRALRLKGAALGLGLAVVGVVGANVVKPLPKNPVTAEQKGEYLGGVAAYVVLLIGTPIVTSLVYHKRHA